MGGGGGRMTPEAGANFAAHRADTAAFDKAVEAATHMPTREVPQAGLNQTNVENSRSIGEQIPWKAANGQAKMHTIDDLNVVTLKDGTTWGYVYHTTDGHLFIQQDQNSRGLGNIGIPIPGTGGSIGWTPAPATHPEPLVQLSQLPPESHVQKAPFLRGETPVGQQLVPETPHQNVHDYLMKRDGADHSTINNWGVTPFDTRDITIGSTMGTPAVGSFAQITPQGAQTIDRAPQQHLERA